MTVVRAVGTSTLARILVAWFLPDGGEGLVGRMLDADPAAEEESV